jgi:hypothetical protein
MTLVPPPGAPLPARRRRAFLTTAALLGSAVLGACSTNRTLTIDSEPHGAAVWVNGHLRGTTPVQVPFVHPGTWTVRLEKPGYSSLAQEVAVASTFSDYPVVDLPGELLVRERRWRVVLPLSPLPPRPSPAELGTALERAHAYRERARREVAEPGTPVRSPR